MLPPIVSDQPVALNQTDLLPQPETEGSGIEQLVHAFSAPQMTFTVSPFVSIHTKKIEQALQLIGPQTTSQILSETDTAELSHEGKIVHFFFKEFLQPFVQINLSTPNCAEISEQSLQPSVVDTGLLTPVIEEDRSYLDESGFGDTSVQEQVTTGFTARGETVLAEFTVSSRGSVCFDTPVHQAYSEKQIVQMLEGQSKQSSSQLFKIKDKNLGHDRGK